LHRKNEVAVARLSSAQVRWLVLFAWMALIAYWSNQPSLPIDRPQIVDAFHNLQHPAAHVLAYGMLGALGLWANDGRPRAWLLAIAITSAFGVTDEFHQSFIPGRRAALDDWLLDTLSAAFAIATITMLQKTRLQTLVNTLSPAIVALAFVFGIGLAVRPALMALMR
jgi:hypothetical protein